jgi:GR25 family glycosyltransferase involved in LPS biosynthesis
MTEPSQEGKSLFIKLGERPLPDCRAFIIHLQRATQRRAQAESLRAALPFECELVDAVDGAVLSQAEIDLVYARQLHRPRFYFPLNRAEIGLFLSHRAVWRRIVEENLDYAVVFEDDAAIDPEVFAQVSLFAESTRGQWDYALAPAPRARGAKARLAATAGLELLRPTAPPLRTLAQFVSNRAARRLLDVTARFDRPIDTFLQMSWVTGIELLTFNPSGVRDASQWIGGSTIQVRRKTMRERLAREISRPLYRAQVRLYHALAPRPSF